MLSFLQKVFDRWISSRHIAIFLLFIALVLGISGFRLENLVQDYVPNIVTECISIAITILIIEELNVRRERKNLRNRLKRELWSKDQGISLRAINELREHGWISDGSLENISLPYSVLDRAELKGVVLNGADLQNSSLQRAYIGHAQLRNIDFSNANLTSTIFNHSDLTGSDFTGAITENASFEDTILIDAKFSKEQFSKVKSLEGATMPDGTIFEE